MLKRFVVEGGKLTASVLFWFVFLGVLKTTNIIDVYSAIDGFWLQDVRGDFVKNLAGDIAFRVGENSRGAKYIYTVAYNPNQMDLHGEPRSLTSLVDIPTWKQIEFDYTTTTFTDAHNKYILYQNSDGNYMVATKR
jgi:hypothetical protein